MVCLVVAAILAHRWQFGSHTAWSWGDWFATLYQFNYLVGFSTEVTIRSKWVIPATVSAGLAGIRGCMVGHGSS